MGKKKCFEIIFLLDYYKLKMLSYLSNLIIDIPPNQTIYIKNLHEKLSKEDTIKALYAMFGQFGKILDVVALKINKLRSQAWVAFADTSSAANAVKTMQSFLFFDKPINIQFAKSKSDVIAKIDGSYQPKKDKKTLSKSTRVATENKTFAYGTKVDQNPPNKMLFLENIPHNSTSQMLKMLFQQFTGFIDVRMVPSRSGIAFVNFETEAHASFAKNGLDEFRITPECAIRVTFAKR